jgi:WD40 repeat protein
MTTSDRGKRPREEEEGAEPGAGHGLTVLHRARIVPWSVSAVTAIAACPDGSTFAAGYEDGKVEVFDATHFNKLVVSVLCGVVCCAGKREHTQQQRQRQRQQQRSCRPCVPTTLTHTSSAKKQTHTLSARTQTIPGSDSNEISGLAWARAAADPDWRLFASTLSGQLLELSCQQMQLLASTDSTGGPIWCLQAAPATSSGRGLATTTTTTTLAAACGDGSVKLFSVHSGVAGAVFERALPRVDGNVLALAWHPNGSSLASGGSDGCIHVWETASGEWKQQWAACVAARTLCCPALLH